MDFNLKNKKNNSKDSEQNNNYGNISKEIDDILFDPKKTDNNQSNNKNYNDKKQDYQNNESETTNPTPNEKNQEKIEYNKDTKNSQTTNDQPEINYDSDPNQIKIEKSDIQQKTNTSNENEIEIHQETARKDTETQNNFTENESAKEEKNDFSFPKFNENNQEDLTNNQNDSLSQKPYPATTEKLSKNSDNQTQDFQQISEQNISESKKRSYFGKKKTKTFFSKRKNKTNQQQDEKAFEQSPNSTDSSIQPMGTDDQFIDNDVLKLLAITDELLGKLPEDAISDFASSEDFELYKKVMTKYNILK